MNLSGVHTVVSSQARLTTGTMRPEFSGPGYESDSRLQGRIWGAYMAESRVKKLKGQSFCGFKG